eukprot:9001455-Alexandrium_andersonii.AAC.1
MVKMCFQIAPQCLSLAIQEQTLTTTLIKKGEMHEATGSESEAAETSSSTSDSSSDSENEEQPASSSGAKAANPTPTSPQPEKPNTAEVKLCE